MLSLRLKQQLPRLPVLLLAFLLVAGTLGAQTVTVGPNDSVLDPVPFFDGTVGLSLFANSSFGVFRNELDAAFSPDDTRFGPTFSTLGSRHLFAGLANLGLGTATDDSEFIVGYFSPDGLRWSGLLGVSATTFDDNLGREVVRSESTVTVVDGDETTNYEWVDNEARTTYYNVLANDANLRAQFLTQLGGMNTGLYVRYHTDNSAYVPAANFSRETDFYYDAADDPGNEEPEPEVNYTVTRTERDFAGRERTLQLGVPLFLQTGDLSHYGRLGFSWSRENFSESVSQDFTTPEEGAVTETVIEDETTDIVNSWGAAARYTLGMPGIIGSGENDRLNITVGAGLNWWSARLEESEFEQQITKEDGEDPIEGIIIKREEEERYRSALGFAGDVLVSHPVYVPLGQNATFGLEPTVGFGYTRMINAADQLYARETIERDYDTAGDLEETTTTTQERVGRPRYTANWDTTVGLPMALDVSSQRLPFGVVLGARPFVTHTWQRTQTRAPRFSSEVVVEDGDGDVTSTTTTEAIDPGRQFNVESQWNAQVDHNLGFYMDLTDQVRLDFALNAANLLEFEDFTIQAIFRLP